MYICQFVYFGFVQPLLFPLLTFLLPSGLSRTFGRSVIGRPSTTITSSALRAFEPLRRSALPALTARFASTDASKIGKIHQVIGAVVDGM
jgi:F-type H+-transporting ATPase subunit beta